MIRELSRGCLGLKFHKRFSTFVVALVWICIVFLLLQCYCSNKQQSSSEDGADDDGDDFERHPALTMATLSHYMATHPKFLDIDSATNRQSLDVVVVVVLVSVEANALLIIEIFSFIFKSKLFCSFLSLGLCCSLLLFSNTELMGSIYREPHCGIGVVGFLTGGSMLFFFLFAFLLPISCRSALNSPPPPPPSSS